MARVARILVVDDERNIRNMIRLTLTKAGHEVGLASDGTDGLREFDDGANWDVALVDHRMPGIKGIEVIDQMRSRAGDARLIMMTAFDTIQLASEALRAGATDFLRKPFTTSVLRSAVAVALDRTRPDAGTPPSPTESAGWASGSAASHSVSTRAATEMPQIHRYLNGFYYWPLDIPSLLIETPAPGIRVRRAFHVLGPLREARNVVVGVVPHVQTLVHDEAHLDVSPDHSLWDTVCQTAVMDYLWRNAEMPPAFLPVYEIDDQLIADIRATPGASSWQGYSS